MAIEGEGETQEGGEEGEEEEGGDAGDFEASKTGVGVGEDEGAADAPDCLFFRMPPSGV